MMVMSKLTWLVDGGVLCISIFLVLQIDRDPIDPDQQGVTVLICGT